MININIFGDFAPIERGKKTLLDGSAIDNDILSIIKASDYNIVNLECPVVQSENARKIVKDGPSLKCKENAVRYLAESGFDMVTLANNHFKDFGELGIKDTFNACIKYGITWVGAGDNLDEARIPKVIEKDGMKIGIVNVCKNETSVATRKVAGSNPIDEINNYYDICRLKSEVDKIIVIIHGGSEHYRYPTPRMKKRCRFYADLGVSAVVWHSDRIIINNYPTKDFWGKAKKHISTTYDVSFTTQEYLNAYKKVQENK